MITAAFHSIFTALHAGMYAGCTIVTHKLFGQIFPSAFRLPQQELARGPVHLHNELTVERNLVQPYKKFIGRRVTRYSESPSDAVA